MNNQELVKIEGAINAETLRILRGVAGVTAVQTEPRLPGGKRPDVIVSFAGKAEPMVVELKRHANAATAWQVLEYAKAIPGAHVLLVAGDTTDEARDILERHGVGVVDGLGNAHIELPGLLVHVRGQGRPRRTAGDQPPTKLTGKAGVAAQALLIDPDRDWQVRDLADAARLSTGLAHRVFIRLEAEGLIDVEGTGPRRIRRLVNPTALLDLWAEENRDRKVQRRQAFRLAPTPRRLGTDLARALDKAGIEYALTGAEIAARVAPFVTAVPIVDVWIGAATPVEDAARAAEAQMVEAGHNVLFQEVEGDAPLAFRKRTDETWRVNDFRLYYDLRNDPRRGKEQADRVRQEVIGF